MTNEEAIKWLKVEASYIEEDVGHGKEILEAYDIAIEALEQEPCNDTISRQEVLDMCKKEIDHISKNWQNYHSPSEAKSGFSYIATNICDMPPVTPQPKTGRWMHPYKSDIACECSECHIQMPITNYFNYCPNCGARMEVSE